MEAIVTGGAVFGGALSASIDTNGYAAWSGVVGVGYGNSVGFSVLKRGYSFGL